MHITKKPTEENIHVRLTQTLTTHPLIQFKHLAERERRNYFSTEDASVGQRWILCVWKHSRIYAEIIRAPGGDGGEIIFPQKTPVWYEDG
jgi:hypothetical protein